jgi:thioredoxin-dependent peroxiredoxin
VESDEPLRAGDIAPDFTLVDEAGQPVSLSDFRGRSEVVLFFYPKDNTAICSAEACAFRDSFEQFHEAGAVVIGVSSDSSDSHRRFSERLRLPFILLSDPDGAMRTRYRVPRTFGLIPGRTTFLIDRNGIIRRVFSSQFQPAKHSTEALAALRNLRQ